MKIVATKRLKDGLNFVIEYMEDGQLHCLFISAEKVVKYYKAVEQLRALDAACACGSQEFYTDKVLGVVCCRCQAPRQ